MDMLSYVYTICTQSFLYTNKQTHLKTHRHTRVHTHPNVYTPMQVIAEGRAALVSSFSVFKFVLVYACIQMTAANIVYSYGLDLGRFQVC